MTSEDEELSAYDDILTESVVISDHAMTAIRAQTLGTFKQTGTQLKDGSWRVPFSLQVLKRLRKVALKGESYSDTIERVLTTMPKDGSSRRQYQ